MSNVEISQTATRASSRLLRIEQAASILDRSPRTVRYHAQKRSWRRVRGLVREDDVYRLKAYLDDYHIGQVD